MLPSIKENPSAEITTEQAARSDELPGELSSRPSYGRGITLKKVMYHPLTLIAIGLHAALLVVPFSRNPPEKALETPEEASEEGMPVDILNLSDITTSKPPAKPPANAALPPLAAASPPSTAPAPSSALVENTAESTLAPAASAPVANTATAPIAATSTQTPPPPAYDPSGDQAQFVLNLSGVFGSKDTTEQTGLPPDSKSFFRKGNGGYFVSGNNPVTVVAEAKAARLMNEKPNEVLNTLVTSYQPAGVVFTQVENYGDELLYQVLTAEGETMMYVSLVDMKASTLMVIWPQRPAG